MAAREDHREQMEQKLAGIHRKQMEDFSWNALGANGAKIGWKDPEIFPGGKK